MEDILFKNKLYGMKLCYHIRKYDGKISFPSKREIKMCFDE